MGGGIHDRGSMGTVLTLPSTDEIIGSIGTYRTLSSVGKGMDRDRYIDPMGVGPGI
jgi:hypothetical protein